MRVTVVNGDTNIKVDDSDGDGYDRFSSSENLSMNFISLAYISSILPMWMLFAIGDAI